MDPSESTMDLSRFNEVKLPIVKATFNSRKISSRSSCGRIKASERILQIIYDMIYYI
jgi:hypothetical protein